MNYTGLIKVKIVALLIMGGFAVCSEASFIRRYICQAFKQRVKVPSFVLGVAIATAQADGGEKIPLFASEKCSEIRDLTTHDGGWARVEYVKNSQKKCLRSSRVSWICSEMLYGQLVYNMAGWGFAQLADRTEHEAAQSRSRATSRVPIEEILDDLVEYEKKICSHSKHTQSPCESYWQRIRETRKNAKNKFMIFGSTLDLPAGTNRMCHFQNSCKVE